MLEGITDSLFACVGNAFSDTTKSTLKGVAKATAFFLTAIAVIKTIAYLTNSSLKEGRSWTHCCRDDDDDHDHDCCKEVHTSESTAPVVTTPTTVAPSPITERVAEVAEQIISSTPTVEDPSSWSDFFSNRFEQLEAATGLNPWSVPPSDE